jgi:hypothetical protein
MFTSTGVLYTTRAILPGFRTKGGEQVSIEQRTQRNLGFRSIDASFDVFLYHLSYAGQEPRDRRIAVYAFNRSEQPAHVRVKKMIEASGVMATADGPESRLAVRSLESRWDTPEKFVIASGQGRVIAWTPRISDAAAQPGDTDRSTSDFVNGLVRAEIEGGIGSNLEVSVIAVGGSTPLSELSEAAARLIDQGATSAEEMDLNIAPPECHVRRVSGVSANFLWRSEHTIVNVTELPRSPMRWTSAKGDTREGPAGIAYLMAAPRVQTEACPRSRQTSDMLLHPGYVHPETIGNYQTEYLVTFMLDNPGETARAVDVRFGKFDADIGLAWQHDIGDQPRTREELSSLPARVQWAGAWRKDDLSDDTRSFFAPVTAGTNAQTAPIVIEPRSRRAVSLRFVPVGTSSMPFMIFIVPSDH